MAIDMKGFSFSYPAAIESAASDQAQGSRNFYLGPLDWSVPAGAFCLLVGSTGSGKTTLLRQLKPELAPTGTKQGQVMVNGRDPQSWSITESTENVGYVAQNPESQVVCSSVWHELAFGLENLGIPQDEMRRRVAEVAHFFGLEPWLERETDALSGGQKQTLCLASTLTLHPKLLLLDEPTAQLDPVAEANLLHALFRVNREIGLTVVVATHRPEAMASYATCAFRMVDGKPEPVELSQLSSTSIEPDRATADAATAATSSPKKETIARLKDAYVNYPPSKDFVLRGCELSIQQGTIHALVGGNGSGKSTTLKAIAGLMKAKRGKIENSLQGCQGFLPQNPKSLFVCDTVLDEMLDWCPNKDYAISWLTRFHLENRLNNHPYDLSGGQQQTLALAKILATKPKLLLLDEPSKGLDPETKLLVAQVLIETRDAGTTIVLSAHDLAFVKAVADKVSMMFDGNSACNEDPETFFKQNLFYRPLPCKFTELWNDSGKASA